MAHEKTKNISLSCKTAIYIYIYLVQYIYQTHRSMSPPGSMWTTLNPNCPGDSCTLRLAMMMPSSSAAEARRRRTIL